MSAEVESDTMMLCCAACGTTASKGDGGKLKTCIACKSAKYCSVKCQRGHWPQHKQACKKRAAELRDELLFKQPESSHLGDCPICCNPLRIDGTKAGVMVCCSKFVCIGCDYINSKRELEGKLQPRCAFCRHPRAGTTEEADRLTAKRAAVNDPIAMCQMGNMCCLERDYNKAYEYHSKAAALGSVGAHFSLSNLYRTGQGVDMDKKKEIYHLEEAAIGGHPTAREHLAIYEWDNGNFERAIKHLTIAATLGHDAALEQLKAAYSNGYLSKEDLASALRAHQAAVNATVTPQREKAEKDFELMKAAMQS